MQAAIRPAVKLVVPFTDLHPETHRATRDWPEVEYVDVSADEYEYGRLLRRLWREGESFCLVEHDVVPHRDTLARFALCDRWYCSAPYAWTTHVGVTLGCTKFGREGLRAYPDAMEIAWRIPCNFGDGRGGHYRQIGVWLQSEVLARFYGEQPCCHLPPVVHLNESQRLLDIHRDRPIQTTVETKRSFLEPGLVERIAAEVLAGD